MNVDLFLAGVVLAVHLAFILWVILGWLVTRQRPFWRGVHIVCVLYGIFIESSDLACPLTRLEALFEERGGMVASREPFILHYLEVLIYPNIPLAALTAGAIAVCAAILGIYLRRYRRRCGRDW